MAFYIPLQLIYIHKQNRHDISAMLRSYHEMRFSPLAFIWKNAYVHASKMRMEVPKWQSCLRSYIKGNSISLIAINGLESKLISNILSTVYLFENYKSGEPLGRLFEFVFILNSNIFNNFFVKKRSSCIILGIMS